MMNHLAGMSGALWVAALFAALMVIVLLVMVKQSFD